jgi:hypothetical protein
MGIVPYHRLDQWIVLASIKPRYAPTRRAIQGRSSGGSSILQLRLAHTPFEAPSRLWWNGDWRRSKGVSETAKM